MPRCRSLLRPHAVRTLSHRGACAYSALLPLTHSSLILTRFSGKDSRQTIPHAGRLVIDSRWDKVGTHLTEQNCCLVKDGPSKFTQVLFDHEGGRMHNSLKDRGIRVDRSQLSQEKFSASSQGEKTLSCLGPLVDKGVPTA